MAVSRAISVNSITGLLLIATVSGKDFVRRQGTQLYADGNPFYFTGFNAYWLNDWAKYGDPYSLSVVDKLFADAKALGMSVGRTWGFHWNLPSSPGKYSEDEFKGLDNIVASAGKHNMRLILVLTNFWHAYLGPEKFNYWAGAGGDLLTFYRSSAVKALYKQHLQTIITRVNTVTGVAYKDDPTIMTWNIMNEPRCPGCLDSDTQSLHISWLSEMSSFVKSVDPNHLVVFGTEGYYMDSDDLVHNPGAAAKCEGEDWLSIYRYVKTLDYANIHVYARQLENIPTGPASWPIWVQCDFTCFVNWAIPYIKLHMQQASSMGIPLVLEEFGASLSFEKFTQSEQAAWFAMVYDLLRQSKYSGGTLMGALAWNAELGGVIQDQSGYNLPLDKPHGGPSTSPAATAYGRRLQTAPHTFTFKPAVASHRRLLGPFPTAPHGRQLQQLDIYLDGFRRNWARDSCAETAARSGWYPDWYHSNTSSIDPSSYLRSTSGKSVIDVINNAGYDVSG